MSREPMPKDDSQKTTKTADKLRGNMEPSDHKHVVLGELIGLMN